MAIWAGTFLCVRAGAPLLRFPGKLVDADLDLPRIGGSWRKGIANSALLQLWVGAGDEQATQGTGLHCDICNNFIIQLQGQKIWELYHPK